MQQRGFICEILSEETHIGILRMQCHCKRLNEIGIAAVQIVKTHKSSSVIGIFCPKQCIVSHVSPYFRTDCFGRMLVIDQDEVIPGLPALVGPVPGALEPIRLIGVRYDPIRRPLRHRTMNANMVEYQIKTKPDIQPLCFFDIRF